MTESQQHLGWEFAVRGLPRSDGLFLVHWVLVCRVLGQPGGKPWLDRQCEKMSCVSSFLCSLECVTNGSRPGVSPVQCRLISSQMLESQKLSTLITEFHRSHPQAIELSSLGTTLLTCEPLISTRTVLLQSRNPPTFHRSTPLDPAHQLRGRLVLIIRTDVLVLILLVPIWRSFFFRASHQVHIVYEKPQTKLFLYLVSFVPYLVTSALRPSMCSENDSTSSSSLSSARRGRAFMITHVAKL